MDATMLLFVLSVLTAPQASPAAQPSPIQCEFRVFDGGDEVSPSTRVRVYASGQRDNGVAADSTGHVQLAPGLYDVQALRERDGQVTGIRWVEHLLIQRYPDEQGHHLEVINFKPQYGALELRTVDQADYDVSAFPAGDRARLIATGLRGPGYRLLVVPAGRYDVRVRANGSNPADSWLPDIDVPVDRTRLRTLRPPDPAARRPAPRHADRQARE
jgi:hypothetical protein